MHAKRPPVALRQDLKVTPRLRGLDETERVFLPGDLQVPAIVTRHLKEDAGVGTAFVALTRGVEEARPDPQARRDAFAVAHAMTRTLKRRLVRGVHLHVREQREVVSLAEAAEMGLQVRGERRRGARGRLQSVGVLRVGEELDAFTLEERRL